MIDVVLLIARLLFVALLYLFLFAIMKTGVGLVRGQRKKERTWSVSVERGPKELRGVSIVVRGPVIVGRSPGADIVIEERSGDEIKKMWYSEPMAIDEVKTYNPSFDVTDASLITGIITEYGILYPPYDVSLSELKNKMKKGDKK